MVTVRSKQCQHGNVSLGTGDDCFRPSGHLKLELPYIMDEWSDGVHSFLSFQIAQLAGPPMKWYVSTGGKSLIGDYKASRNLVDLEKALSGFVDKNKKKLYEKMPARYVTSKLSVRGRVMMIQNKSSIFHSLVRLDFLSRRKRISTMKIF